MGHDSGHCDALFINNLQEHFLPEVLSTVALLLSFDKILS